MKIEICEKNFKFRYENLNKNMLFKQFSIRSSRNFVILYRSGKNTIFIQHFFGFRGVCWHSIMQSKSPLASTLHIKQQFGNRNLWCILRYECFTFSQLLATLMRTRVKQGCGESASETSTASINLFLLILTVGRKYFHAWQKSQTQ